MADLDILKDAAYAFARSMTAPEFRAFTASVRPPDEDDLDDHQDDVSESDDDRESRAVTRALFGSPTA